MSIEQLQIAADSYVCVKEAVSYVLKNGSVGIGELCEAITFTGAFGARVASYSCDNAVYDSSLLYEQSTSSQ